MKNNLLFALLFVVGCNDRNTALHLTSSQDSTNAQTADSLKLIEEIKEEAKPVYVAAFTAGS